MSMPIGSPPPALTADGRVPFEILSGLCAAEGLHALGVLAPPPDQLDPTGIDRLLSDGVGDMHWLAETRDLRLRPTALKPTTQAIAMVALPYQVDAADGGLRRARYAAGKDYHVILREKLARVGRGLATRYGQPWGQRATVDSAPVNERTLARLAGLGWIGRNALLIRPESGTWHFLGALLTEAPLTAHHAGHGTDRCGRCTACETRCPTAALADRRVISERCISYLTIEHRGAIARDLARRFEGWWFGCDLCQEVCPWNRHAGAPGDARLSGTEDDLALLAVTADTFDIHFAGRAIRRIGYERFRRNLLVALWSIDRHDAYAPILAEGLPLVLEQAQELGIAP